MNGVPFGCFNTVIQSQRYDERALVLAVELGARLGRPRPLVDRAQPRLGRRAHRRQRHEDKSRRTQDPSAKPS